MQHFDVVWYGRAAAWVGAALILLMAVTGRQVALVTVAAILGLIVGMGLLLYSIPGGRVPDTVDRLPSTGMADGASSVETEDGED